MKAWSVQLGWTWLPMVNQSHSSSTLRDGTFPPVAVDPKLCMAGQLHKHTAGSHGTLIQRPFLYAIEPSPGLLDAIDPHSGSVAADALLKVELRLDEVIAQTIPPRLHKCLHRGSLQEQCSKGLPYLMLPQ